MSRRLPPLGPLKVFESAARHGHFLRAAEELCITPGAVSQQIRQLEDWLGIALFDRVGRGVRLNETGKHLAGELSDSFDRIALATSRIQQSVRDGRNLTVSTTPSFSARWLIPRLGSLKTQAPDLDVRILVSIHPVDFAREAVNMAVRFGRGAYPDLQSQLLFRDVFIPVCSPKLLENGPPLKTPDDLEHFTLLHEVADVMLSVDWLKWLKAAGAKKPNPTRGPYFAYTHMALQAALDGQGVALTPSAYVLDDLEEGRLVRPFAQVVPDLYSHYLVCPLERASDPAIAVFWSWALKEVLIMQTRMDALGLQVN